MADQTPPSAPTCPSCGHLVVAHEPVVRDGKAWFALDCFTAEKIAAATSEGRVYSYCGHCEDGCPMLSEAS